MPIKRNDHDLILSVFGLTEGFSLFELKHSYRKLAKKYHPDGKNDYEYYNSKMKEINDNYAYLKQFAVVSRKINTLVLYVGRKRRNTNKNAKNDSNKQRGVNQEEADVEETDKHGTLWKVFDKLIDVCISNIFLMILIGNSLVALIFLTTSMVVVKMINNHRESESIYMLAKKSRQELMNLDSMDVRGYKEITFGMQLEHAKSRFKFDSGWSYYKANTKVLETFTDDYLLQIGDIRCDIARLRFYNDSLYMIELGRFCDSNMIYNVLCDMYGRPLFSDNKWHDDENQFLWSLEWNMRNSYIAILEEDRPERLETFGECKWVVICDKTVESRVEKDQMNYNRRIGDSFDTKTYK